MATIVNSLPAKKTRTPPSTRPLFAMKSIDTSMDSIMVITDSIFSEEKQCPTFFDYCKTLDERRPTKHENIFINPNKLLAGENGEQSGEVKLYEKPTLSYIQLIMAALRAHPGKTALLSQIYTWIMKHFEFYRYCDSAWKGSIRHNLSLSKLFKRVPRPSQTKGKGGYWILDEDYLAAVKANGEFLRGSVGMWSPRLGTQGRGRQFQSRHDCNHV